MIYIITGKKKVGKTTLIEKISEEYQKEGISVGGVITKGQINRFFVSLKDQKKVPFQDNNCQKATPVGKYHISASSLDFANNAIRSSINEEIIFIDELGRLEEQKQGLFDETKRIIREKQKARGTVVLIVRKDRLESILNQLKMRECEIIEISKRPNNKLFQEIKNKIRDSYLLSKNESHLN